MPTWGGQGEALETQRGVPPLPCQAPVKASLSGRLGWDRLGAAGPAGLKPQPGALVLGERPAPKAVAVLLALLGFSVRSKRELYENADSPRGWGVFPVRLNLVLNKCKTEEAAAL